MERNIFFYLSPRLVKSRRENNHRLTMTLNRGSLERMTRIRLSIDADKSLAIVFLLQTL
jgi:hypothetical protein